MTAAPAAKDPHRIVHAEFLAGAGPGSDLPAPTTAEVAFAGRSNVGKSSLINALVDRKNLVRTSSTPGSTRQLNLYEAKAADGTVLHLVDLPGYGFTRRSKAETSSWQKLIEGYLSARVTLGAVVILVDVRRGLEVEDEELIAFIDAASAASRRPPRVLLVATKIDKLPKAQRGPALARLAHRPAGPEGTPAPKRARPIGFSAVTGEGKAELWSAIRRAVLGVLDAEVSKED